MYPTNVGAAGIFAGVLFLVMAVWFVKKGRGDIFHWIFAFLIVLILFLAFFYAKLPWGEHGTFLSPIWEPRWPPHWPWDN